jgi:hypothetical protein
MGREERKERQYASALDRAIRAEKKGGDFDVYKLPKGAKLLNIKKEGGQYRLDVLPYVVGKGNPNADEGMLHYERTYIVHRHIGVEDKNVLCLKSFGNNKRCPICEHRQKLWKDGRKEEARAFNGSVRQVMNVIDLDNKKDGIQILDQSHFAFGEAIDNKVKAKPDRYERFFAAKGGRTLEVSMTEESFSGNSYAKVSNLDMEERKDYPSEIEDQTFCLDKMFVELSYDELKKIFEGDVDDESDSRTTRDDDDDRPVRRSRDEDEDEPVARRNGHSRDEEDEDRPRKRNEEDDDDKPVRRASKDDDDDDKPVRRTVRDDDDSDEDEDSDLPKRRVRR